MIRALFCGLLAINSLFSWSQGYQTEIKVAQDGSGDYTTIQAAIDATKAFPDDPVTIYIKAGEYKEKVRVYSWNTKLSMIGEKGKTIVTYDDYFNKINLGRNSTFHTYTLKVEANDFYASNLIIRNTAGEVGQAVAIHVEGDRVVFEDCEFDGFQDTMYLAGEGSRQYFKNCKIAGSTDFIFGEATALFEGCEIISKKSSYITAASTSSETLYGFVFRDCELKGDNLPMGETYLGRPWRGYAKTVFINCKMGAHIHPAGWKEWNSNGSTFYGEFGSAGPGGNSDKRVSWSIKIPENLAKSFTAKTVFRGWQPRLK